LIGPWTHLNLNLLKIVLVLRGSDLQPNIRERNAVVKWDPTVFYWYAFVGLLHCINILQCTDMDRTKYMSLFTANKTNLFTKTVQLAKSTRSILDFLLVNNAGMPSIHDWVKHGGTREFLRWSEKWTAYVLVPKSCIVGKSTTSGNVIPKSKPLKHEVNAI